jgi:hypothetical protein
VPGSTFFAPFADATSRCIIIRVEIVAGSMPFSLKTNTHVIHQAEPKLNVQQCVCEVENHCMTSYRSGRVSRAGIESNLSDTGGCDDAT